MTRLAIIFIFIFSCLGVIAQRQEKVVGTYTYYATDNQTPSQVKYYALQYAQAEAIAKAFSTKVSLISTMTIDGGKEHFSQVSENNVNGVWIKNTKEPEYVRGPGLDGIHGYSITCTVEGIVREKNASSVPYISKVFCNGFSKSQERDVFNSGDKFYMLFSSPVDGYLTIYSYDCSTGEVGCALPYERQTSGTFEVQANTTYRLFSKKEAKGTSIEPFVQEYQMETSEEKELSVIYVIFSPNRFYKSADNDGDVKRLRNLRFSDFEKWLGKLRTTDDDITITRIPIEIYGNQDRR